MGLDAAQLRDLVREFLAGHDPHAMDRLDFLRARLDAASTKLLIVLVNTDPRNVEELGAPFYHAAVAAAISRAHKSDRPNLIACRTTIAFGAPTKAGTAAAHGAPLGAAEIAGARERLGWGEPPFVIRLAGGAGE